MRPVLKSALRRGWRDGESLQFGVDPRHAVVLAPVDGAAAAFLELLDGTRGMDTLTVDAAALGLGPEQVRRLLARLAEGGALDDAAAHSALSTAVRHRTPLLDRLRPDLAALSLVHPAPGAAPARIRHRRASRVRVLGAGRVGSALAAVLSAAGVGAVDLVDSGRVEPWDAGPCGIPAEHVGDRRDAAGRAAVRRAAPEERRRPADAGGGRGRAGPPAPPGRARGGTGPGSGARPGPRWSAGPGAGAVVTVVAPRDGLDAFAPEEEQARALVASGVPHLYAGVLEGTGVVGPLVLPGRTACGQCLGLLLAGRDPAWPLLLAQLRSGRRPAVPACDIALATTVAGTAAGHVLAQLDGRLPPSAGARLELPSAGPAVRTLPVPGDARCGCGAAAAARTAGQEERDERDEAPRPGRADPLLAGSFAATWAQRGTMAM
ncbi:ThiF family adenylyltransferase [Streptomyces sp. V4-01]|uniref:ThiF family adenylyltransferase n=1 Tax=Actinacidiphila polyblastidii TaxID=3110430 RepID=A0ABU7PBK2_9ACTN|nr:ThiF family adenylyltransferase [Streptomyces sp. V4-01]